MTTSVDISTVENGTIVRDDGNYNRRWIAVKCYHPESGKGCGNRRFAKYHGPLRSNNKSRLCQECNLNFGRKNNSW